MGVFILSLEFTDTAMTVCNMLRGRQSCHARAAAIVKLCRKIHNSSARTPKDLLFRGALEANKFGFCGSLNLGAYKAVPEHVH